MRPRVPRSTWSVSGASPLGHAASTVEGVPPQFPPRDVLGDPPVQEPARCLMQGLGSGGGDQVLVSPLRDLPVRPPHRGPVL